LEWTTPAKDVAGYVVEWSPDPSTGFNILQFVPPAQTAFVHRDLRPDAASFYRVRAFYGQPSSAIEVSLDESLSDADYVARYGEAEDFGWAVPKASSTTSNADTRSLRVAGARAAPQDFSASRVESTVSGFRFTWTDRASDEEGTLFEVRPAGAPDFQVRAVVAPDVNSIGYALEPPARKASFRVRAFYFGSPSNVEVEVTGARADRIMPAPGARG